MVAIAFDHPALVAAAQLGRALAEILSVNAVLAEELLHLRNDIVPRELADRLTSLECGAREEDDEEVRSG